MRKLKNVTDHCMLLGDEIKDELNEQITVGNRKTYSIVVCIVASRGPTAYTTCH